MYTFDHDLFLALNFDGGPQLDRIMLALSGTTMWLPLYALILWLVWRRTGWRGLAVFTAAMIAALAITPDSLHALRRMTPDALAAAGYAGDWAVHVPPEAVSGRYGTVSAHAATIVALAVLSAPSVRRRWFTLLMVLCTAAICYSRIYLGKHFPMDLVWGSLVGAALGRAAYAVYRRFGGSAAAE